MSKLLSILIGLFILAAVGMLIYSIARPVTSEKFTEFYILGLNGKAELYPSDFVLNSSQLSVVSVQYGSGLTPVQEKYGRVTPGIVNHEQETASYSVVVQVDGKIIPIIPGNNTNGANNTNNTNATDNTNTTNTGGAVPSATPTSNKPVFNSDGSLSIMLAQGEMWEGAIGFAPTHLGDNQKVEFFLYKDGAATAEDTLHLLVNVK